MSIWSVIQRAFAERNTPAQEPPLLLTERVPEGDLIGFPPYPYDLSVAYVVTPARPSD